MRRRVGLFLLVSLFVFVSALFVQAQTVGPGGPFREGEIAVFGAPQEFPGAGIVKYLPHAGITVLHVAPGREWAEVRRMRQAGRRVGVNRIAEAFETPNDPLLSYQWHFRNVQAESAWDLSSGKGVTVAVLDTGLAVVGAIDGIGCLKKGTDIVNGDTDPDDGDGHGTHVSGTIAQETDNGTGVAGLAFSACVMPVKVLDDSGSGSFADISDGIYWAVDQGAEVINMSLGTNSRFALTSDPVMDPALDYAYAHGVTVVCASGNDGNRKNVSYPAIYPTTIAVGATDYANSVTRYSNKGLGLDLVAPGGDTKDLNGDGYIDGILQETRYQGTWGYYFFTGTSMASPHVAAVAALLYSEDAGISPDEVKTVLTGTTLDLDEPGYDSTSGWGLLQAFDAVEAVLGPPPSGSCTDADGDGWCVEDGDCNDSDPKVYPGANDTRGRWGRDGVDNDCNGIIDG